MLVYMRGAGDIATGIATRLHRAGCDVVMGDVAYPTSIRRTVCFSEAIRMGSTSVEGIVAEFAAKTKEVAAILDRGHIAVMVDPTAVKGRSLYPDVLIDAILAKQNRGTCIDWAPIVIAAGPGFSASVDCHAVVETKRGHYLGRVIYQGAAIKNTGIPGIIEGHGADRVLRAPATGVFEPTSTIGSQVGVGDVVGMVNGASMKCAISGVLRGLLAPGIEVVKGMKSGDVDPRGNESYCYTVSDKARAVGGGVLEALLQLSQVLRQEAGESSAMLAAPFAKTSEFIDKTVCR